MTKKLDETLEKLAKLDDSKIAKVIINDDYQNIHKINDPYSRIVVQEVQIFVTPKIETYSVNEANDWFKEVKAQLLIGTSFPHRFEIRKINAEEPREVFYLEMPSDKITEHEELGEITLTKILPPRPYNIKETHENIDFLINDDDRKTHRVIEERYRLLQRIDLFFYMTKDLLEEKLTNMAKEEIVTPFGTYKKKNSKKYFKDWFKLTTMLHFEFDASSVLPTQKLIEINKNHFYECILKQYGME